MQCVSRETCMQQKRSLPSECNEQSSQPLTLFFLNTLRLKYYLSSIPHIFLILTYVLAPRKRRHINLILMSDISAHTHTNFETFGKSGFVIFMQNCYYVANGTQCQIFPQKTVSLDGKKKNEKLWPLFSSASTFYCVRMWLLTGGVSKSPSFCVIIIKTERNEKSTQSINSFYSTNFFARFFLLFFFPSFAFSIYALVLCFRLRLTVSPVACIDSRARHRIGATEKSDPTPHFSIGERKTIRFYQILHMEGGDDDEKRIMDGPTALWHESEHCHYYVFFHCSNPLWLWLSQKFCQLRSFDENTITAWCLFSILRTHCKREWE